MKKLSVVISAYNEEKNIEECLNSVKWVDEIILVDNSSADKTAEIASSIGRSASGRKKPKIKIFIRPNKPMLNINKNYGFTKATGEWILSLDADERVSPELRGEIKRIIRNCPAKRDPALREKLEIGNSAPVVGFWIPRKNIIFGKWIRHSIWWPDYQLRLFKKDKGKFPCKHVHEYLEAEGETKKIKNPLIHYNYQTVSQYLYKLDKIYTENEAENIIKSGRRLVWQDALRMPSHDFLKTFFAQEGYKDGLHGLVLSLFQSFYALVVFVKVWEKQGFKENKDNQFLEKAIKEFKNLDKEFKHWLLQIKLKTEKNILKKIITRFCKMV